MTEHHRSESDQFAADKKAFGLRAAQEMAEHRRLWALPYDDIGRVLRAHLLIERYMNAVLERLLQTTTLDEAKLDFFQKVKLLPRELEMDGVSAGRFRGALLRVNEIRNKLAHQPAFNLDTVDLTLVVAGLAPKDQPDPGSAPIDVLEYFANCACGLLTGYRISRWEPESLKREP